MSQFMQCVLMFWIGGMFGGATIALGIGANKGWTIAGGVSFLAVWPFALMLFGLYLCFGAKMDSCDP